LSSSRETRFLIILGFPHGTKSEASFGFPLLKGDGRGIYKGRGGSIREEGDL